MALLILRNTGARDVFTNLPQAENIATAAENLFDLHVLEEMREGERCTRSIDRTKQGIHGGDLI